MRNPRPAAPAPDRFEAMLREEGIPAEISPAREALFLAAIVGFAAAVWAGVMYAAVFL
ncbi:MAG: hypothetical protein AB1941_10120 [Gemmatimonadota bacterium]